MRKLHAAFILAAGLGERLRPITDHVPKPLLPVFGKPVIARVLEHIIPLTPLQIGINLHYRGDMIRAWAATSSYTHQITFFPEEPILGTGGALKNAASLLRAGTFLVHNADVLSDMDLSALIHRHHEENNLVTLAVYDDKLFNTVLIDEHHLFVGLQQNTFTHPLNFHRRTFTGIAVYEPEFLDFISQKNSPVTLAWQNAQKAGHRIGTYDISDTFWSDIGTPEAYAKALFDLLRKEGEMVYFNSASCGCATSHYDGYVVIEKGANISGANISNSIVLNDCNIQGQDLHNMIVYPGGMLNFLHTSPHLSSDNEIITEVGCGGSDRNFFRIQHASNRVILMQCSERDEDFHRQIEFSRFFAECGISVPQLLSVSIDRPAMLFEDLGDITLYHWLRCPRPQATIESMYRNVLAQLVRLHSDASKRVSQCPMLAERIFDYDYLRWESSYFLEQFVNKVCRQPLADHAALDKELHEVASIVDAATRTIIHRDCQCQNIMLKNGKDPYLIDFQGSRLLTPAYDIASLLWDPYYHLEDGLKERLLHHYLELMLAKDSSFDHNEFIEVLIPCRLQRHMQALGAYGFLALVKKKKSFLKHIPEGLRLLKEDAAAACKTYPILAKLIEDLNPEGFS
jgi:NDP-sugar pyrophosphorylase family protein/aminoglycoside/choline kinase family phosphotransferase